MSPNPLVREFKGCFHCGKPDHARTAVPERGIKGCPEFEALVKAHNGKLPGDYKGAYEKWLVSTGKDLQGPRRPSRALQVAMTPRMRVTLERVRSLEHTSSGR